MPGTLRTPVPADPGPADDVLRGPRRLSIPSTDSVVPRPCGAADARSMSGTLRALRLCVDRRPLSGSRETGAGPVAEGLPVCLELFDGIGAEFLRQRVREDKRDH